MVLGQLVLLAKYLGSSAITNPDVMKTAICIAMLAAYTLSHVNSLSAQNVPARRHIIVDVAHGQRFYDDPATTKGNDIAPVERVKYMTGEIEKNASSLNADVSYQKNSITPKDLAKCDLLFIHVPTSKFSREEIEAIQQYLHKGGALFLVMDEDYWSTLAQTNVNDIVSPYGIAYKDNSADSTTGGYTKAGLVTDKQLSIPYHGARVIEGGAPFCFSKQMKDQPFGIYKGLKEGGKIIAMGDGMVSLYMTKWAGVDNYQCAEFMQSAFAWLLK